MLRRAKWLNILTFVGIDINIFVDLTSCSIEFTDNMSSLEESNRKQTLAVESNAHVTYWFFFFHLSLHFEA